jgi:glycosyltransferase involved in cell wall biosynthesis
MKNKKIQISVIIVSLNTKKDFIKTIRSTLKQSFKNKEIIIVDGYSTDGTIDIIKQLQNKSIKAIIEKDKGIYDAMNKGIKYSNGKWIIFMNSGDIFYNQNVLKNIFLKKINKYDVLYGDTLINNNFFNYRVKAQKFSKKTVLMPFCHQSTVIKKKLLLKFNFLLKYKISSDFNFFIKSFLSGFYFCNLNMIISKISSKGISDIERNQVYNENINIIKANNNKTFLILKLLLYKNVNFFKNLLKFMLPNSLILIILKLKYNKF